MIFACCHPDLERQSQLALTLKLLCGLGDLEVARGLMSTQAAVKRRVSRAKRELRDRDVDLSLPPPSELPRRLDVVHEVLYLLFNEGYSASRGDLPVRIDLCEEAARLCHLMCEHECGEPSTHALLALMLYHSARLLTRMDGAGGIVLLQDQDRTRWDWELITVAETWFQRSAQGTVVSRFHLEAGISRLHCLAKSPEETDWTSILRHYDILLRLFPSPLYRLNRAVALGKGGHAVEAISELRSIEEEKVLTEYPLLHCALADLLIQTGETAAAKEQLQWALKHIQVGWERSLVEERLGGLD